ncbi:MAG: RNA 2',3'-cyclic phosphodiesterase [Pseudomonadota bacterium]
MPRLFVAVELPEAVKQALLTLQGGVKGARWQTPAQLHLSLRFIGEVDGARARDIDAALAALRFSPFAAASAGVGHFGKNGFERALWAGLDPEAPFIALHKKIDRLLSAAGLEAERRKYKPHVTLARFSGSPRPGEVESFLHRHGLWRGAAFTVGEVGLFLSELGRGGAHYAVVGRYPAS